LIVWVLTVEVRIVRAALECSTIPAVLAVVAQMLTAWLLLIMVFASTPQPS
jgi:hypothetical protein